MSAVPGGGGVVVERIHPVKYTLDNLPEMQDHLIGIFPEEYRQSVLGVAGNDPGGTGSAEPSAAEAGPAADVYQSPFPASSGVGDDVEDTTARPETITEIDILKKLLEVDFSHVSWHGYESTHWQSYPGFYLVYKPNSTMNMPAINGRNGAPHPCEVEGSRWTLAWWYSKVTSPATGQLARNTT